MKIAYFFKRVYKNIHTLIYFHLHIKKLGVSFDEYSAYVNNIKTDTNEEFTILYGKKILRTNKFWYTQCVIELLIDKIYTFKSESDQPTIIDCGANIGLSIIFFKRLYPNARIIAFEADTVIYEQCKYNINQFEYNDVELINSAVWINEGTLKFQTDNSLGGKLNTEYDGDNFSMVKSVRLKEYLEKYKEIDFLKIDIEGAEYTVLQDSANSLNHVKNLFVEYHSYANEEQNLNEILTILSNSGFRYYIKEAWNTMQHPFEQNEEIRNRDTFDLQLNIFAYR